MGSQQDVPHRLLIIISSVTTNISVNPLLTQWIVCDVFSFLSFNLKSITKPHELKHTALCPLVYRRSLVTCFHTRPTKESREFHVYLKWSGAELQAFLHVRLQLVLDADLLVFGQSGHWESSDHCLLPHWTHIETNGKWTCTPITQSV